jgi:hypothetical protein
VVVIQSHKIGSFQFEKVGPVEVQRDESGCVSAHLPQDRYHNDEGLPLHRYGNGPFCKFRVPRLPSASGVYAYVVDGEVKYIGETQFAPQTLYAYSNIAPRMCFRGGQERSCRINNLIYEAAASGSEIELWFSPQADHKSVELDLRNELRPPWNRI